MTSTRFTHIIMCHGNADIQVESIKSHFKKTLILMRHVYTKKKLRSIELKEHKKDTFYVDCVTFGYQMVGQ